jgi:hypothetical protein
MLRSALAIQQLYLVDEFELMLMLIFPQQILDYVHPEDHEYWKDSAIITNHLLNFAFLLHLVFSCNLRSWGSAVVSIFLVTKVAAHLLFCLTMMQCRNYTLNCRKKLHQDTNALVARMYIIRTSLTWRLNLFSRDLEILLAYLGMAITLLSPVVTVKTDF